MKKSFQLLLFKLLFVGLVTHVSTAYPTELGIEDLRALSADSSKKFHRESNALLLSVFDFAESMEVSVTTNVDSKRGVVSHRVNGCDHFLVYVPSSASYSLMEWYGGYDPDVDDVVYGDFSGYGFRDIFYSRNRKTRVYLEDWLLSRGTALEKLIEECE